MFFSSLLLQFYFELKRANLFHLSERSFEKNSINRTKKINQPEPKAVFSSKFSTHKIDKIFIVASLSKNISHFSRRLETPFRASCRTKTNQKIYFLKFSFSQKRSAYGWSFRISACWLGSRNSVSLAWFWTKPTGLVLTKRLIFQPLNSHYFLKGWNLLTFFFDKKSYLNKTLSK